MKQLDILKYEKNAKKFSRLLESYQRRHTQGFGSPLIMSFLVTNRCFLKCKHCFYHETLSKSQETNLSQQLLELTIDEYEKISQSMDWFLTGIFCGGEPFMRDDFHEIIHIFQKNNRMMVADSASNGQMTERVVSQTQKILERSTYSTYSLGISIDGFQEFHDEIRGQGTFDRCIETFRELKKLQNLYPNFEPYICTTMNTINQDTMERFIRWSMDELEPTKISLIKTRQSPRDGNYLKDIEISNYRDCVAAIDGYIKMGRMGDINKPQTYLLRSSYDYITKTLEEGKRSYHCYAGLHGGFIDYNGDVSCCEVLDTVGNLRENGYNFREIWNSPRALQERTRIGNDLECSQCTHESEGLLPSILFAPNKVHHFTEIEPMTV